MLKLLMKHRISSKHIPQVLVKMRVGGSSNKSLLNILKANIECYRAWKEHDLEISPFFILRKPFNKLTQYYVN
ncbi:MAG TPA: hypothetical protein VLB82_09320 [Thermodesulfobacteriota bacterium]|nr:hypothetical protein [Thermodesulfobacteriota bacterium]